MPNDKKKSGGKNDKGKKGGKKSAAGDTPSINTLIMKRFLNLYETYSAQLNSKCCPDVVKAAKACLEEDTAMTKLIVRAIPKDVRAESRFRQALEQAQAESNWELVKELQASYSNPPKTYVSAVMKALTDVQFCNVKELYIFDLPILHKDMNELVYFISITGNPLKHIELLDCMLGPETVGKFSTCLNLKAYLTEIILDYNEFGDKGCKELCKGLMGNRTLLSLSLNYCNLGSPSGGYIATVLATTALREIYLDGNQLRCQGAMDLIREIAISAENADIQREIDAAKKLEEAQKKAEEEANKEWEYKPPETPADEKSDKGKKKKKKKKKGKKKKTKEPPPVGPVACKIHLADNAIDVYEDGAHKVESYNIMHQTVELFIKLIKFSEDIQEIDLHNNAIGNMSAKMLLAGLDYRKKNHKKWGGVAVRVTEKIDKDLFAAMLKASKKMKKKKKRRKKK